MNQSITELVYILDRSGSMSGLEQDTIGGYNSLLERQKKTAGDVFITTVLFDDKVELLHDHLPLAEILPMTEKEYFVRGSTALLDAVGLTIQKVKSHQALLNDEQKAEKILFVITTDGMENASREYTYETVQQLIKRQTEVQGWEFIFMGANIDAAREAARFGIRKDRATQYISDKDGVNLNFQVISSLVSDFRDGKEISEDWAEPIQKDVKRRKK